MDFEYSARTADLATRVRRFVEEEIIPAEDLYEEQLEAQANPHAKPPILAQLQEKARAEGLWNLFMTHGNWGAGLTNLDYAPLMGIMGESVIGPEVFNCSAPDTGNMEILALYGTEDQKDTYLKPLLAGEIRSAFAMTEPAVASSDARNVESSIRREGDEYVINGRKWYASGAIDPDCAFFIFMGKSDPNASTYRQQSMILVPRDAAGVTILRDMKMFGYIDRLGHGDIEFKDVRVPASNMLGEEGGGFAIAQGRLGPGRMHYAMRAIGFAERAFGMMCKRALEREAFGGLLADRGVVREWIARSRMEIEQNRLQVLRAAWQMDTQGNSAVRADVSAIKVSAMEMAHRVVDRAVQLFGAAGVSQDTVLAQLYAITRALQIADGPTEVHLRTVARHELKRFESGGAR